MKKEKKSDDNFKIEYENYFVAFLDVLGFKEMVYNHPDKINKYFQVVNEAIEYVKSQANNVGFITISDSIIISMHHDYEGYNKNDIFQMFCRIIGFLQRRLASNDIWIRGAISSGEAYFNETQNQIVGKAYIDAYNLEESLALYPRVIIDSRIIKELGFENAHNFIDTMNDSQGQGILFEWNIETSLEKDVPFFIDYISSMNEDKFEEYIQTVIKNIEKNIYEKTELYKKFQWVSEYLRVSVARKEKSKSLAHSIMKI